MAGIVKVTLTNLKTKCSWLFTHVYSSDSGLQGFNFLGNAVVAELHSQLAEALLTVFSPGELLEQAKVSNYFVGIYVPMVHYNIQDV